ncbi:MAG TPA: transglycosylase SLT domain-containing protein [Candidatus Binatia bacterium]|nr:transglycosylase SLT domain-containing protein [Candidatus Binatia bacterium]
MIAPIFNATIVRREAGARFRAATASLPTAFAQILAHERATAAATRATASSALASVRGTAGSRSATTTASGTARAFPDAAAPWLGTAARRALASAIHRSAASAGVAPELALGVAIAESSLEPTARSSDGVSTGTFQVTRVTASQMRQHFRNGAVERPAGSDDVALGVGYLRYLDQVFRRGDRLGGGLRATPVPDGEERARFAVAAFNAGEGRVASAQRLAQARGLDPASFDDVEPFLPTLTRRYVERVVAYAGGEAGPRTQEA